MDMEGMAYIDATHRVGDSSGEHESRVEEQVVAANGVTIRI